jgi:hypothetical protein
MVPSSPEDESEERTSFERLARPLAKTLSMPVVRSIGRITSVVVPAAAAMLMMLYSGLSGPNAQSASAPPSPVTEEARVLEPRPAAMETVDTAAAEAPMAAAPKPRVAEALEKAPAAPALEANAGLLSINTRPWSTVYLGKRMLGTTPLARVSVPNTSLKLKFVDRDGRVHVRRIAHSEAKLREIFFDFED